MYVHTYTNTSTYTQNHGYPSAWEFVCVKKKAHFLFGTHQTAVLYRNNMRCCLASKKTRILRVLFCFVSSFFLFFYLLISEFRRIPAYSKASVDSLDSKETVLELCLHTRPVSICVKLYFSILGFSSILCEFRNTSTYSHIIQAGNCLPSIFKLIFYTFCRFLFCHCRLLGTTLNYFKLSRTVGYCRPQ